MGALMGDAIAGPKRAGALAGPLFELGGKVEGIVVADLGTNLLHGEVRVHEHGFGHADSEANKEGTGRLVEVVVKEPDAIAHAEVGGGGNRRQFGVSPEVLLHEFDGGTDRRGVVDRPGLIALINHRASQQEQLRGKPRWLIAQQAITTTEQARDVGGVLKPDAINARQTRHLHQGVQADALDHNGSLVQKAGIARFEALAYSFVSDEQLAPRHGPGSGSLPEKHIAFGNQVEGDNLPFDLRVGISRPPARDDGENHPDGRRNRMMFIGVAENPFPVLLDALIHQQPFFTCNWLFVLWQKPSLQHINLQE